MQLTRSSTCLVVLVITFSSLWLTQAQTVDPCASFLSADDKAAGLDAFIDPVCLTPFSSRFESTVDHTGCFHEYCRYCKAVETDQSKFYNPCSTTSSSSSAGEDKEEDSPLEESTTLAPSTPSSTSECMATVSDGDNAAGISAFYDLNCVANGGVGCYPGNSVCRFCKIRVTPNSKHMIDCPWVQTEPSPSPTSTTPTPTTTSPYNPSATSTETPSPTIEDNVDCNQQVSNSGLTGVSYVNEDQCNIADPALLGCVANTKCRLCRNDKSEANQFLISCKVLQMIESTPATTEIAAMEISTKEKAGEDGSSNNKSAGHEKEEDDTGLVVFVATIAAAAVVLVVVAFAIKKTKQIHNTNLQRGGGSLVEVGVARIAEL